MKLSHLSAALASLCLLAASAQAQDAYGSAYNLHKGFYVNANAGTGLGATKQKDGSIKTEFADSIGASGFVGYMFTPNIGLEAGVTGFAVPMGSMLTYGATVVGNLPIGQRLSLFAKVGGGAVRTHFDGLDLFIVDIPGQTITQGAALVGAGMDYSLSRHISANLQYNGAMITNESTSGINGLLSLGLTWHFS